MRDEADHSVVEAIVGLAHARLLELLTFVAAFVAYWAVLALANPASPLESLASAAINSATLVCMGVAARSILRRYVFGRSPVFQTLAHILLALLFTLFWYWLLMVALGLARGRSPTDFDVRDFFPGPAVAWQLLQGLACYGLFAALSYAQWAAPSRAKADGAQVRSRFFIKLGEEIRPVDASQIIAIVGAGDYSEVATSSGKHLVKMTLSEFEAALDPEKFLRVHRSRIVNADQIVRAEPAGGGRLLVQMEDGDCVTTSRAGAKLLRDRVI